MSSGTAMDLARLSRWIDEALEERGAEARTWGRLAKITEEAGEVIAAYIGATGQNPRKGVTHSGDDVIEELLDVAVTALAAVEHLTGNQGRSLMLLDVKICSVVERALPDDAHDEADPRHLCDRRVTSAGTTGGAA